MLEVGMKLEVEKLVTDNDTASKAASGAVEVLATPFMIAWMEEASLHLAQKGLENGLTTVGTEVNIKHLKGTLVGKTVKIVSVLREIDRKKLVFDVETLEDGVVVGTGTHTRFIIDPVKFYEKLKNANAKAQEFINKESGANLIPAFELATWGLQAAEAMAWEENKKADTPILNGIAAARGVDENVLKAAALKKAKQYSKLTAHVAGERQAIQDRIQSAKTIEEIEGIVIGYTLPEEK